MTVVLETHREASHHDTTLESQSLYNLAIEKITRNRFREALDHLVDALRMAPTNSRYLSYFGFCIAQVEGDHARAVHVCKQAVNSKPLDPICRINLGKVYKLMLAAEDTRKCFFSAQELEYYLTLVRMNKSADNDLLYTRLISGKARCFGGACSS